MTTNWEKERRFWDTYGRTGPFKATNYFIQAGQVGSIMRAFHEKYPEFREAGLQGLPFDFETCHSAWPTVCDVPQD